MSCLLGQVYIGIGIGIGIYFDNKHTYIHTYIHTYEHNILTIQNTNNNIYECYQG